MIQLEFYVIWLYISILFIDLYGVYIYSGFFYELFGFFVLNGGNSYYLLNQVVSEGVYVFLDCFQQVFFQVVDSYCKDCFG